jgi:SAM-dependent methyltransferase
MNFDARQFKRLERAGYNRLGPRYLAQAATRQALADAVLAAAQLAPGQRVLDLASGPGLLAKGAQSVIGPAGIAVASDIAEAQLACCPGLIRVAADGEHLPFAAASFDRVLCGLGLMLFPDTDHALREMRRVMAPQGRLVLSVWSHAAEVPLLECALACMRRILPPPKVPRPSIFRFGDVPDLERRLTSADFCEVSFAPLKFSLRFDDVGDYWQAFLDLAGGAAESLARLPEATQERLAREVEQELAPYAVSGGYRLVSQIRVVTAALG